MTKPFEIEELLARIRSALRFSAKGTPEQKDTHLHEFNGISIHDQTREVRCGGEAIELTPREYDLLFHLLKHPNQVLTREQLLDAVWGYDYYGDTNVVDVYIRYVRKKIDPQCGPSFIHTVRGVGYALKD